ncbi:MAG: hypothetical protein FD177_251 [Desulfovibrionaceae bacterium]|nr:MAG: hypothetical protein FD177_251 [Desulfovibrionaceae bacterium]
MRKLVNAINWESAGSIFYAVIAASAIAWTSYVLGGAQARQDVVHVEKRQRSSEEAAAAARRMHQLTSEMHVYPFGR